ncbi:hexosaminidase D-like isoform X1 [Pecten maximus]|uniref:hexosaminidase D-like isoform X1 n=2 Tax=Pecten maximus TaxID=6579 RepID=UPI0014589B75|nr:hexosaminidase D-like isoform X1 [Pecten maximus]
MAHHQDGHRLVHLDLKGAPPKVDYFEKIFPWLKRFGATGLLIEYEDMFPYWGDLEEIACEYAYSKEAVERILQLAADNDLIVIPLVQTFGHFEFVLKHDKFVSLREVPTFPMALCPSNPDSLTAVTMMIDQVIELHPGLQWFHIGADEVYHIGVCDKCKKRMSLENLSTQQLFFAHTQAVLLYLKAKHPNIKPIMWDDMLRFTELPVLQGSGLGGLVEVMVWHYLSNFLLPADIWDKFSQVFPNIWFASAFKGATGSSVYVTNIKYHVENHLGWLQILEKEKMKFHNFRGFTITGWQRYDHYAILCELLPQALPSLAICLAIVNKGTFSFDIHNEVSKQLKSTSLIPINAPHLSEIPHTEFPGSDIYKAMLEFIRVDLAFDDFMNNEARLTWMNEYHLKRNFANPVHVEPLLAQAVEILDSLQMLYSRLQTALSQIFYPNTVDEWLTVFPGYRIAKLSEVVETVRNNLGQNKDMQT